MVIVLFIQHGRIGKIESSIAKQNESIAWNDPAAMYSAIELGEQQSALLDRAYASSRKIMKILFLLLIVFPTAVWFPYQLAQEDAAPKPKPQKSKVVNIRDMTRDDVGLGIPAELRQGTGNPQNAFILGNVLAFAIPTAVMALFVFSKPQAYGGPYPYGILTLLLFGAGALITFAGMMLAIPMRRSHTAQQVMILLLMLYVVTAGLAWYQL